MAEEHLLGLMEVNMWAIGNLEREKVMELELILMEGNMKVNGKMEGLFDGQGTYIFEDGRRYEGEWKNDKIWNAKMYNKEGNVIKETVKEK